MNEINSVRQGDIAFRRIDKVPEGYELTERILEVWGETGRHVHRVEGVEVYHNTSGATVAEKPLATERTGEIDPELGLPVAVIRAFVETLVIHDVLHDNERPHPDKVLPPGIWEVRRARQRRSRRVD